MAIYHFSAQIISRGQGKSAVAAAAYRSGERLMDERTGETKYYRRDVEPDAIILAPSDSPEWIKDRGQLWNAVEQAEKRKDAQLARELNVALPKELSNQQQKELIQDYIQNEFVNKGMIADIAIHRDDKNNPHAHIMLTTRTITTEGFGPKNRDWNDRSQLEKWREEWANYANRALEREGVQERISHLSHETRGLETLPTIHLGHVAHDMERKGTPSDRGNINRERHEYNRLVVDLQKYKEEKQAIEQEKARQAEKKKQITNQFNTPVERVDLQNASKLLKAEPNLEKISIRQEQLAKWETKLNNGEQFLRWKDVKIGEAAEHYRWIHSFEKQIQDAENTLKSINWLNPLKIKENRSIKERAEQVITKANKEIQFHQEKLQYHQEKLKFGNEKEFSLIKNQHETEHPGLLEKNQKARQQIHHERDILQKAEIAQQNTFVRQMASLYPEQPEMRYMDYKTALQVAEINQLNGKVTPIESIQQTLDSKQANIQKLEQSIQNITNQKGRLQRAEGYLKEYEKYQDAVTKFEENPFLKGKRLVSKSAKQEYSQAVSNRDRYQDLMQKEGISSRKQFEDQSAQVAKAELKIPVIQGQIQSQQIGLGLLNAAVKGIGKAQRDMQKEQERQQRKSRSKSKTQQQASEQER